MRSYIENNRMADFQDHHYPSEMSVDAMIQTFLLDTSDNAQEKFLKKNLIPTGNATTGI